MHPADLPYRQTDPNHDYIDSVDVPLPSSTRLDSVESESQERNKHCPSGPDGPCTCSQSFRHSGWKRDRHRVYEALKSTDASEATLERFADCGAYAWVFESPGHPGDFRIGSSRCKSRWCTPCANQRSRTMRDKIGKHVRGRTTRFLTLTVKNTSESLLSHINHLNESFRALRRTKAWKQAVEGGVAFLEIKQGQNAGFWHPHLHVIIEGTFLAKSTLVKLWHGITGDSYIVDIRAIRDGEAVTRYVTKYVTKPLESAVFRNPKKLVEAMKAIKGRKIAATFGTWRGLKLTETEPLDDWIPIAPLNQIIHRAHNGDAQAIAILESLRKGQISCNTNKNDPSSTATDLARDGP